MHRFIYLLAILWLAVTLAGCASMSKKDCETADWHTIGYNDGAHGIYYSNLDNYRKRCSEYQITPDANAYQTGWNQGIRSYCTGETGYRIGMSGQAYQNICPADLAPGYLAGWQQGVQQYCAPDNGLRQGLAGYPYRGVCPSSMADDFQNRYRLGLDVRQARANHQNLEYQLDRLRKSLATEQDPHRYHELLDELARLRHREGHSAFTVRALEACTNDDWFDAGLSDGESGNPYQADEIDRICRNYGSGEDEAGYRDGWSRGNNHYCSYDSGLYAGQSNQEYRGVCNGPRYGLFWSGYLRGIQLFQSGRYDDHPRPQYPHEERSRPRPIEQPDHRQGNAAQHPGVHGIRPGQGQLIRQGKAGSMQPAGLAKKEHPVAGHVTQPGHRGSVSGKKPTDKQQAKHPDRKRGSGPDLPDKTESKKPTDKQQMQPAANAGGTQPQPEQ